LLLSSELDPILQTDVAIAQDDRQDVQLRSAHGDRRGTSVERDDHRLRQHACQVVFAKRLQEPKQLLAARRLQNLLERFVLGAGWTQLRPVKAEIPELRGG